MKENLEMEIKAMKLFFLDWIRLDLFFLGLELVSSDHYLEN